MNLIVFRCVLYARCARLINQLPRASKASWNDASLFETEIAALPRSRHTDNDVIHQVELQNSAGFENSSGEAMSASEGAGSPLVVVHHDEGIGGVRYHRLKDFSWMSQRLMTLPWLTVQTLIKCCFAFRRTTRSHSRSKKRISEQRSAIATGLSMVSDWRSSRSVTAPMRRELTRRSDFERETKGKSS